MPTIEDEEALLDEYIRLALEEDLRREMEQLEAELADAPPFKFSQEFHDKMLKVFLGSTALDYRDDAAALLTSLGCRRSSAGYPRMVDMISIVTADETSLPVMTGRVLKTVAMEYGVSEATLQHSLARIVEAVWKKSPEQYAKIVGQAPASLHKPSLTEFIDALAAYIRR